MQTQQSMHQLGTNKLAHEKRHLYNYANPHSITSQLKTFCGKFCLFIRVMLDVFTGCRLVTVSRSPLGSSSPSAAPLCRNYGTFAVGSCGSPRSSPILNSSPDSRDE